MNQSVGGAVNEAISDEIAQSRESNKIEAAFKLGSASGVGRPSAEIFKTQNSLSDSAPNSALVVVGKLGDRCTRMSIDTGSAVSLVRADVWREATELSVDLLTPPV